jgi:hypothetical protein
MRICRFCHETIWGSKDGVKYGTRHYAHFHCFNASNKGREHLSPYEEKRYNEWLATRAPQDFGNVA